MKDRQCFRCGKLMDFDSFIKNISPNEQEKLTNIWNSNYIELFCCNCYVFKIKYQPRDLGLENDEFSYY